MIAAHSQDGMLVLTLDRPDKANALTAEMLRDLTTALDGAAAEADVRAVILTGAGRVFSAGADLDTVREYFDRVILLSRELVAAGPVAEVFSPQNLRATYGAQAASSLGALTGAWAEGSRGDGAQRGVAQSGSMRGEETR